ncbi:MAG: hypothetical protein KDK23_05055 [Leptospiraceae bacterium]|nr:hypothetical protein [Leptospiraceae bacterium]
MTGPAERKQNKARVNGDRKPDLCSLSNKGGKGNLLENSHTIRVARYIAVNGA